MSSQNAFPGPNAGRPLARPTTQTGNSQPSWVNPQVQPPPAGRPQQQPANAWPPQQPPAQGYPNYQQPGYGQPQPEPQQPNNYGQWSELQPGNRGGYGGYPQETVAPQPDPYAPQFEPYVPPSRPNYAQPQQPSPGFAPPQQPQPAPQWPARSAEPPRGYDPGDYGAQSYPAQQPVPSAPTFGQQQYHENELSAADWAGPHDSFGADPYQQQYQGDSQLGFGQADGGELEPVYNDEELEYEDEDEEEAPRGRRPILILAALVGAIVIGGGMAYGYKKLTGGGAPGGTPPVIKSDDFAAKTKPADAGGKQFPYSDTKIMGRLGDGTSSASAAEANGASAGTSDSSSDQSTDDGGPRKVSTLVVGRDGTIMPTAMSNRDQAPPPPSGDTGVPGTSLVNVFGQQGGGGPPRAERPPERQDTSDAGDSAPAKRVKPVKITTINSADDSADSPPPKKKYKRVARAEPTVETDATAAAPPVTSSSGTGFVAVLASVPHSSTSRIDALKRFADMQQKYSAALAGKTPDIASASLSKGVYDRLVVGPPGSRAQASSVCVQLKAQGYHGCWVTTY
jgi:hypothetical protein